MATELAPDAPASARRGGLAGPFPVVGFLGALLIAVTAPTWRLAFIGTHEPWRLTLPGVPSNGTRPFTAIAFLAGVVALGVAWLGLIARLERSAAPARDRMRTVLATALLWFAPVMLGPPLLSSDVYSYAAEGAMVTQHHDPTSQDMAKLRFGYLAHVDPVWRSSLGNPYGPVQMGASAAIVKVAGNDYDAAIWGFRFLALGGVLLSVWGIAEIARHYGVSPPVAVAIGIANPIAVLHLVGGAHNDALLMGLLCTGFAFALRRRFWLGVAFMALATAVKLPAAAGIVYLAWCHPGARAALKERVRLVAHALAVATGLIATLCLVVGISFGWVLAMKNSGITTGTLSFTTRSGYVFASLLRTVGLPAHDATWIGLFRIAGLGVAAYLCLRLLGLAVRIGPVAATGLCLLAVMLLGPVVWPWYLGPAFALLGATRLGRWRASVLVLCALFAAEVLPVGVKSKPVLEGNHFVSVLVILLIAAVTFAAPLAVERWHDGDHPVVDRGPARSAQPDRAGVQRRRSRLSRSP